jgi:alpha-ketoglutarate-dependent taurine dioxygenase
MNDLTCSLVFPDDGLLRCISPAHRRSDPFAVLSAHRDELERSLPAAGGILFRGFGVADAADFARFVGLFSGATLDYRYGSSPRSREAGNVFTSTEYPAREKIPLHNEMSYTTAWPLRIWFYSQIAATTGGETPLADSRRVYRRIPPAVRERFEARGVRYVRNYSAQFDVSWQKTFQTDSRGEVEAYCRGRGITFEWSGEDGLRTSEICQASATHPVTGERLWMNQAHLFHVSALKPEIREYVQAAFPPDKLPRNAYFGDGETIPDEDLDSIRRAYDAEERMFRWEPGDVLMLDNMAMAHGRNSFSGPRRVLVTMTEAHDSRSVAAPRSVTRDT